MKYLSVLEITINKEVFMFMDRNGVVALLKTVAASTPEEIKEV
jgi:hypothetical protein